MEIINILSLYKHLISTVKILRRYISSLQWKFYTNKTNGLQEWDHWFLYLSSHQRTLCQKPESASGPWGCLNINMSSYRYRDPHVKDETVLSLTWESPIPGGGGGVGGGGVFLLRWDPDPNIKTIFPGIWISIIKVRPSYHYNGSSYIGSILFIFKYPWDFVSAPTSLYSCYSFN